MKPNVKDNQNGLAQKALILCGILAVGATAFGVGNYSRTVREFETGQQDAAVLDRLVEARKFNLLVQELNRGHVNEARKFLKVALASDIRQAQVQAATANPAAAAEVKFALAELARDQKAHPEYYAVEQAATVQSPRNMQIARHEATH